MTSDMTPEKTPATTPARREDAFPTHRDLMPEDLCPHLVMKQIVIGGLDDKIYDGREDPGDGYYWCELTCHDIGPDDDIVHPRQCRLPRACHPDSDQS